MNNNTNITEIIGINTVERDFVDPQGYVLPSLNSQEKGMAYDGYFTLFVDGKQDVKHHGLRCNVQVKGREVPSKELERKTVSFQVDMDMLKIYQKEGGVLYFVVCMSFEDEDETRAQAFYKKLLPFDIKEIIEKKGEQKSASIKLKAVPKSRGKKKHIVQSFIEDSEKQKSSYVERIPTYKELVMDFDKWNLEICSSIEHIFDDPVYVYRSKKDLPNYKQAVMKVQIESISRNLNDLDIALDDTVYYKNCKHMIEKDNVHKIRFGKCLEFSSFENDTATIKFTPKGRIDDIIKDAEFIRDMLSAKVFRIGDFSSDLVNMKYDGIDNTLEFARKIKKLFKKLHIDKEIDLTVCTDRMYNDFMTLYEGIVEKKPVIYDLKDKRIIRSLNIYGAHIPVVFAQNNNGELIVYDMFDISKGKFTVGWKIEKYAEMRTTIYTMLCKENFIGLGKRNCDNLKKCIKDVEYNRLHGDRLVNMLLEMVKAYYEDNNNLLFSVTKYLANYLLKNDPNDLNLINYYMVCDFGNQIAARGRKRLENRLKYIENVQTDIKYAAALYILLDKRAKFIEKFNSMSEEDKDYFRAMPIMKLADRKFGKIDGGSV